MKYFTTLLSFILLIHLSDLSAQRKSGRQSGRNSNRNVATTDSTATKDKNQNKSTKSARTSSSSKDSVKNDSMLIKDFDLKEIESLWKNGKFMDVDLIVNEAFHNNTKNAGIYYLGARNSIKLDDVHRGI